MPRMTEAKKLTELRRTLRDAGLSQAWAAKKLDVTAGYLGMIFNGKANPSTDLLHRVEALTGKLKGSGLAKAVS
jgi:transcriptional regulator with XRE-family HTH domain